jgi:hypothetical protein
VFDCGVADLTDENHKASRGVVVRRVGPNHEDSVHDGDEGLSHFTDVLASVDKVSEEPFERLQILEVLVGFGASGLHLLLQLREGRCVGGLVLFEELQHFLDALGVELVADRVQVLTLVSPEVELCNGVGMHATFENVLGVLLEDVPDLTTPLNNSIL